MNVEALVEKEREPLELLDEEMDIEEQQQQTTFDITELGQAIQTASESALTSKTVATYQRYSPYLISIMYPFFANCYLVYGKLLKNLLNVMKILRLKYILLSPMNRLHNLLEVGSIKNVRREIQRIQLQRIVKGPPSHMLLR